MREMKDSGIEWIGEIPADWTVCRFKNIANIYNGNSIKDEDKENYENANDAIPYIATKDVDVTFQSISYDNGMYVKKDDTSFKRAPKNSTLLCIEGGSAGKKIAFTNQEVCFINKLCCFYSESICNKLLFYYMLSPAFTVEFNNNLSGLIGGVSISEIKDFSVVFPNSDEQQKIASFLDQRCAEIDAVIEKTKATIEEYKKLKQSVITEAVTKGVRGNRPMKNSGIEWIGEIPDNWSMIKANRIIVSTQNGLTRRDLEKSDGQIVLKLKNITAEGYIAYEEVNRIKLTEKEIETYALKEGDFLFVRVNGSKNLVGKCAIYQALAETVAYNDHIIRVRLNSLCNKHYFHWYLMSNAGKAEIDLHTSTAAGQYTISGDGLRDLYVVLPSNSEQIEIDNHLKEKCAEIDTLIAKKTALLEEMENYKKSVIYEYVTGKKEVI